MKDRKRKCKKFFLTFFSRLPIDAAREDDQKMVKQFLVAQAVKFYFFSFSGFKVCLKVS
jgi:hypothetical protein